jgi:hypothetical protein
MPSARLALALAVAAAAALAPSARGVTDPRDTAVLLAAKPSERERERGIGESGDGGVVCV